MLNKTNKKPRLLLLNLNQVESDLLGEIANLQLASTGYQHEGSVYGARKDYDLVKMQVSLVVSQLGALREALNSTTLPLKDDDSDSDDDNEDDDDDTEKNYDQDKKHTPSNGARENGEAINNGSCIIAGEKMNGHAGDERMDFNGAS